MRVLQLVTRRQLRGAEVFAARLSEGLVRRGVDVLFVGLYSPGEEPLAPEGVPVDDLADRRGGWLSPRLVLRLAAVIRRFHPHVIQANGSDTLKYAAVATRLPGARRPLVYRNISVASHWAGAPWKRFVYRRLLSAVDRVVSVSDVSRADFLRTYGYPSERAAVVYRGVEIPREGDRKQARRRLAAATGADPAAPLLLHVGSLTAEKNHAGILQAFRRVLEFHPGAHLGFAGRGSLESTLRRQARELGIDSRVTFLGLRPDAPDLTAGADLLLLFSDVEGVPGVALEAGARSTPAVAPRVGGVPEAVVDGETGLLVPPRDVDALARAITGLLRDPERCRALGRGARKRIVACFDLERAVDQFLDLYRELIDAPSTS